MTANKTKNICALILLFLNISCGESETDPIPEPEEEESTLEITSTSRRTTDHNRNYFYLLRATSTVNNPIEFTIDKPGWIEYDQNAMTFNGIPGWERLNTNFNITITATNAVDTVVQSFNVGVQLGEIICSSDFGDPAASEYTLPFKVGEGYLLSQGYCPSNPQWGHHQWFAYDFDMHMGTDVVASRSGQVIATRENNPDGTRECGRENFVFIQHDDGTVMQYVHLRQNGVIVNNGDRVERGQILGASGDSGCSIGPHLHVALFLGRTSYNRQYTLPLNYSNTNGPLDANNGLVQGEYFTALSY